jgi:hypothetical protein
LPDDEDEDEDGDEDEDPSFAKATPGRRNRKFA